MNINFSKSFPYEYSNNVEIDSLNYSKTWLKLKGQNGKLLKFDVMI